MDKKTLISNLELQVTQKIQLHFPRGVLSTEILTQVDNCPKEILSDLLFGFFKTFPDVNKIDSIIRVDYYIEYDLPKKFIHPNLESKVSCEYDISHICVYAKIGKLQDIYLKINEDVSDNIENQLDYYDLLAIKSKGLNFCQSNFLPIRSIIGLKGAIETDKGIYFPALEIRDNELVIAWYPVSYNLKVLDYIAKFFKFKTK